MVDSHHDMVALDFETVWRLLRADEKLSAVKGDEHLFSFRLRPAARVTPATAKVLIDGQYYDAGWLREGARQLEPLPRKLKQAPIEGEERRKVYRLFDEFLLQGALPPGVDLIERTFFERANLRAYQLAKPEIYEEAKGNGDNDYLRRIRNCGSLSPKQEALFLSRIENRAKKAAAKANSTAAPAKANPPAKTEQEREAMQKRWDEWNEAMRQRRLFPDEYEGEPEPPEPPKP
jgi:hypothetical protein